MRRKISDGLFALLFSALCRRDFRRIMDGQDRPDRLTLRIGEARISQPQHPITFSPGKGQSAQSRRREFIAKTTGTTLKKASELAAPVDPTARFGQRGTPVMVMGWVTGLRKFNGGRRAVITLDDRTAQVQVPFNEDAVMRGLPRVDTLILVSGNISPDTFTGGYQIYPRQWLDEATARSRFAERVILRWPSDRPLNADRLAEMLTPARDPQGCPVTLHYSNNGARATLDLGAEWKLGLHPERLEALRQRIGEQHLDIVYRRASFETPQHDYES